MKHLLLALTLIPLAACTQTSDAPTTSSVTVLKGDDFERGMASLELPNLSAEERVAVISVYGAQDTALPDINFSVGSKGLEGALPPTVQPDTAAAPLQDERRARRQHELFQQNTERAAALRRAGTPTVKEQGLRTQGLGDNCPTPYEVDTTSCDFYLYDEEQGERLIDTTLRFESTNAYWFVDQDYADEFRPGELERLAQIFEDDVAPVDQYYFGAFPDFDDNGKISIVFSSLPFYGYVNPLDLLDDDDVFFETGSYSNEGDIFYAYLPSDNAALGTESPEVERENYFKEDLPATMVHELKHLISIGQRLSLPEDEFLGFEEAWAEEASAVAAEELSSYGSALTGYAQDKSRGALTDPAAYRVVDDNEDEGPEGDSYYGYNFLLLWRIAERVGHDNFWKDWTAGPETGVANIEKNAEQLGPFADMMTDWAVTLMFDHTDKLSEYDYEALNLRDGTWQNVWYNAPLASAVGETRSLAFYLGYGSGEDALVSVRSSDPEARVAVVRFTGDLPY